ncbi:globin [Bacillaceae bacterium S4-13-58]
MEQTLYEAIGGAQKLEKLVDSFYGYVHEHPTLIPIFPNDLTETARKQKLFLTQFLGGPALYTEEHGHPMLRARHLPFAITPSRRDAWLECMEKAITEANIPEPYNEIIFQRLTHTAQHMINTPEK